MAILSNRIKTFGITLSLMLLCILSLLIFIRGNYISCGEYVSILYYQPITIKEILLMALICIGWCGVSFILFKRASRIFKLAEGVIYFIILLLFSLGGNKILESRKMYWPAEYHPQPIEKIHKSTSINQSRIDHELNHSVNQRILTQV